MSISEKHSDFNSQNLMIDEIVRLTTMKDENIDFSDIPKITDFSCGHFPNEELLKRVPKEILRSIIDQRTEAGDITKKLSLQLVEARKQANVYRKPARKTAELCGVNN